LAGGRAIQLPDKKKSEKDRTLEAGNSVAVRVPRIIPISLDLSRKRPFFNPPSVFDKIQLLDSSVLVAGDELTESTRENCS
jgi:hypothetical protein